LRDEFDLRRREIGIGVDRHAPEGDDSGDGHGGREHQHQKALTKRRLYDSMDHSGADAMVVRCRRSAARVFVADPDRGLTPTAKTNVALSGST
jgi:hypothetical protein